MRGKLLALSFALAAAASALGLFSTPASAAGTCTYQICCPDTGKCYCCSRPCSVQCP